MALRFPGSNRLIPLTLGPAPEHTGQRSSSATPVAATYGDLERRPESRILTICY